jgi:hypothetical protein
LICATDCFRGMGSKSLVALIVVDDLGFRSKVEVLGVMEGTLPESLFELASVFTLLSPLPILLLAR